MTTNTRGSLSSANRHRAYLRTSETSLVPEPVDTQCDRSRNRPDEQPQTMDELVSSCSDLAVQLARRFSYGTSVDPELIQVAMLGVVAAASRYQPEVGPFRPFAKVTAVGELKKHLRSAGWLVRVPRRIQEATLAIARATEDLQHELRASPTPSQIADRTGLPLEDVLLGLRARNGRFSADPAAIDSSRSVDPPDTEAILDIRAATEQLDRGTSDLLRMRYDEELTQREVAARFGVSQTQVHRREAAALAQIRTLIDASV